MKILFQYRKPGQSWQTHGTGFHNTHTNDTALRLESMKRQFPEGTSVRAVTETGQLVEILL
jgi:hypothetical protein